MALARTVAAHELRLLARNTLMWFRFVLFYIVFAAVMGVDARRAAWDRFTVTLIGLIVLAAVGVASALSSETFAQEKERGTMEALLLVPIAAPALMHAKLVYVTVAAMCGVLLCLATGPLLIILVGELADITYALNRATLTTAFIACPPSIVITGALGTIISCRVRSQQAAAAAATLASVTGMIVVIVIAYVLSTSGAIVTAAGAGVAWIAAVFTYRTARVSVSPQVMIRTRGR